MIQLLKSYTNKRGKKMAIGQKVNLDPKIELQLIEEGKAKRSTWDGTTIKMKTDFFKPKK